MRHLRRGPAGFPGGIARRPVAPTGWIWAASSPDGIGVVPRRWGDECGQFQCAGRARLLAANARRLPRGPLAGIGGTSRPSPSARAPSFGRPAPPALTSAAYALGPPRGPAPGGAAAAPRTADQTQIALFWADDAGTATPPGHWNVIAQTSPEQRGTSLAENARLFALLNVSLADAGILLWVLKFTYDFWRPITAIRRPTATGNPDTPARPELGAAAADAAVPLVHLGPQHLQRGRRGSARQLLRHRQMSLPAPRRGCRA